MNPIEFRKVILVGLQYARPHGPYLSGPDGLPLRPIEGSVVARIVFWVPQKPPYQRRGITPVHLDPTPKERLQDPLEGYTLVANVFPHELQALRDGALVEEVYDFQYPRKPSNEQLRKDTTPIWEKRCRETLGFVPNGAPLDDDPRFTILFTGVAVPKDDALKQAG